MGAVLLAFAPLAQACLWEIKITSEGFTWEGEDLGLKTMRFLYDPASLDVCSGPGEYVTCVSGQGIHAFSIRTRLGETILHNSFLEPWFLAEPYARSEDGGAVIAGSGGAWTWTNPEFGPMTVVGNITVSHLPEPGTLGLLGLGLACLGLARRRRA
jgi:hypothetical protein